MGLLDYPGGRKEHDLPVPRVGGVALVIGTLSSLLLIGDPPAPWFYVYAGGLLLLAMGLWDDCVNLRWPLKLGTQLLAALLAVVYGDVRIDSITLLERIDLPNFIAVLLSVLVVVGVTNAINLTDGLDGLAGGTTLLIVLVIGWFAYQAGDVAVATVTAALAGALLGFLRFNTHPARVFMGDSGSQFLGYMVAIVAILCTQGADTATSAALPLLILAWPIIDTANVMFARLAAGVSPFTADRRHLHHRLLALGLDHYQSVISIYAVHGALFLAAYALRFESDVVIVAAFALFAAILLGTLRCAEVRGLKLSRPPDKSSVVSRQLEWLKAPDMLPLWLPRILVACVFAYPFTIGIELTNLPSDLALLAAGVGIVQIVLLMPLCARAGGWRRLPAYVIAVMLVYIDMELGDRGPESPSMLTLFAVLGTAVLLQFRFSVERRQRFTTLDMLVMVVAILTPLFGTSVSTDAATLAIGVVKVVALLYAIEFLDSSPKWLPVVGYGIVTFCAATAVAAVMRTS